MSELKLKVIDPDGAAVEGAVVSISGMRSSAQPGAWISYYRGTPPKGTTDANGEVSLEHVVWVDQDGLVSGVDLNVEHPDFVPFRNSSFQLDTKVVELQRGATVVVTGWHGDPSNTITDIQIQLDQRASLGMSAWKPQPDGRLSTSRLTPGLHLLAIAYEDEELGTLRSAPHQFTLGTVGWETIHLELLDPMRLEGELDPRVPRPVEDGFVRIVIRSGGLEGVPVLTRTLDVEVESDGSFVVEDVRPGQAFIVAIAGGWASAKLPHPTDPDDTVFPTVDLPQDVTPFVVPMVETGRLEVTVLGPDGEPAEATVFANPNYRVRGVGSSIVPGRDWAAATNDEGVATFPDVPANEGMPMGVSAPGLQLPEEDRIEGLSVSVKSGETATLEIRMEKEGK
ncbi:MAG: hypothetical protein AAGA20_02065 [Planctomycetota bacterium]